MDDIELKNIGIEEFKEKVYSYYVNIFPEEERKSLELIELSYKKQYTKIIEILYQNKIVGFMLLNRIKEKGYSVLDYLGILQEYRNRHIGSKLIETVENFYRNKGFENINLTTYSFQAPDFYKKCGFEVEFVRKNKENSKLNKYYLVKYF